MNKQKVVIIILNWNSSEDTINLLGRLPELTYKNFQTLIVDNHSSDESVKRLAPHIENIAFIQTNQNLGYAGGNNIGIERAIHEQTDYVWILNPDIRPTQDSLSILVESMEQDASLAAVGPRICYHDKPHTIYSDGGFIFPEKGFLVTHKNHNKTIAEVSNCKTTEVDYVNGSAILMRMKTLRDIGKFREDFFLYYEETEWCLRAKRHGWNIANNNNAIVYHRSSPKNRLYHYYMARNRILLSKVFQQYRIRAFKVELFQLGKFLKKPYRHNLLCLTARLKGICSGLITTTIDRLP